MPESTSCVRVTIRDPNLSIVALWANVRPPSLKEVCVLITLKFRKNREKNIFLEKSIVSRATACPDMFPNNHTITLDEFEFIY